MALGPEIAGEAAKKIIETGEEIVQGAKGLAEPTTAAARNLVAAATPGTVPSLANASAEGAISTLNGIGETGIDPAGNGRSPSAVPSREMLDPADLPPVNGHENGASYVPQEEILHVGNIGDNRTGQRETEASRWVKQSVTQAPNGSDGTGNGSREFTSGHSTDLGSDKGFDNKARPGGVDSGGEAQNGDPAGARVPQEDGRSGQGGGADLSEPGSSDTGSGSNTKMPEPNGQAVTATGSDFSKTSGTTHEASADSSVSTGDLRASPQDTPYDPEKTYSAPIGEVTGAELNQIVAEAKEKFGENVHVVLSDANGEGHEVNGAAAADGPGAGEPSGTGASGEPLQVDGPVSSARTPNDTVEYTVEHDGKHYTVTTARDGTISYKEIGDQGAPSDLPRTEEPTGSSAEAAPTRGRADGQEVTYDGAVGKGDKGSPEETLQNAADVDVRYMGGDMFQVTGNNEQGNFGYITNTIPEGCAVNWRASAFPPPPAEREKIIERASYTDVTGRRDHQGQAQQVYANVTDAQHGHGGSHVLDGATDVTVKWDEGGAVYEVTGQSADGGKFGYTTAQPPAGYDVNGGPAANGSDRQFDTTTESTFNVNDGNATVNGIPVDSQELNDAVLEGAKGSTGDTAARTAQDTEMADRNGRTKEQQVEYRTTFDQARDTNQAAAREFNDALRDGPSERLEAATKAYNEALDSLYRATYDLDPRRFSQSNAAEHAPAPAAANGNGTLMSPDFYRDHPAKFREDLAAGIIPSDFQVPWKSTTPQPEVVLRDLAGNPLNGFEAPANAGKTVSPDAAPAAGTGTSTSAPAEVAPQGQVQYKVKEAPAAAQAQVQERPNPAKVRQNENTTTGWKPSRTGDGLIGPTGEKIQVAPGDGTTPVVLGNRAYYNNGDLLPSNTMQGHREAANAAVNAVNQTAGEGTKGVLNTSNTAVHGEVMVLQDPAAQAPSADIPAYKQALEQVHGGQVGPTVLTDVVLNPDGSLNSAQMHTMHRMQTGEVKTIVSEINSGTIATPSTEGGNYADGTNPTAMQYFTRDTVHSVPDGGPEGQRYLVIASPGAAYGEEVVERPQFSGEISPAAARVLKRYHEEERQRQARVNGNTDGTDDGGSGGRGRERTRQRPQDQGGEPGTQGQARPRAGKGREQIIIEQPKIVEPELTPTSQERERANGKAEGRGRQADSDAQGGEQARGKAEGQPEAQANGNANRNTRPNQQGYPDQTDGDGQPRSDGRGDEKADQKAQPKTDGKPDEQAKTEEKTEGQEKTRRRRRPSARDRARAEARARQQADEREAKQAPKAKPDPSEARTLYEILGIKNRKKATQAEIKKKYRDLARISHPDTPGTGNEAEFRQITNAYTILSNEKDKKSYDAQLAIRSLFDTLGLRRRAPGTPMEPGAAYPVGKTIGEIAELSPQAQTAWALHNLIDTIVLLNGYKQIEVDPGLFGKSDGGESPLYGKGNTDENKYRITIKPVAVDRRTNGITLRVDQIDPTTGTRTGATDYLQVFRDSEGNLNVRTSEGLADVLDDPKLKEVGKDGGPVTDQERADAAVRTIADALSLDYEQVQAADPVKLFEQAQETASSSGGGTGTDDDPNKKDDDEDDGDNNGDDTRNPWAKKDDENKVPQKPLWQMTEGERRAFFEQQVEDRMAAMQRELTAKREESGEKLRVRGNETIKEAADRRIRTDKKKIEEQRLQIELQVMKEMIDELQQERRLRIQSPEKTSVKEQKQLGKTINQLKREVILHQDAAIQEWRHKNRMGRNNSQPIKEFRWGGKARGKKGNTHKRGYTGEQMANMRHLKHPNRPENRPEGNERGPGRGPERKPNGKRKKMTKEEFKQRRIEYKQASMEHDHHQTEYLNLKAKKKALKAQLSKLNKNPLKNSGDISTTRADLKAVNHQIKVASKGMSATWRRMEANSYHGMALRSAGRAALNLINK